ncbi:MAG: hypothetical protein WB760_07375 [Xanthobacteraceae bacterium]
MSTAKRLALIAAGYVLSAGAGLAAVAVNELRMSVDVAQGSPGMVAFGDMILFVLATGFFSLVPTWFLLKLTVEKAPRILLAIELLAAALGPVSWLTVMGLVGGPPGDSGLAKLPAVVAELLGLFIAFGAIPRMVFGPVLLVIEAATFFLIRGRVTRALLLVAMLMDLVPLGMFALHLARATRY